MGKEVIRLGCEVEDVTAKVRGMAIGRIEYLDGSIAWLIQPPYDDEGRRIPTIEVQDAYAKWVGDGIEVKAKPVFGFHARNEAGNGSQA